MVELNQKLISEREMKQDYLVNSGKLVLDAGDGLPMLRVLDGRGEDCMEPMELSEIAHKQLGGYLRIPVSYYDRMLEDQPELLAHNVNSWLRQSQDAKLLRTMDGTARALLSNHYRCVDNLELLQVINPIIEETPGLSVESCGLTQSRMYLKVVNEKLQQDVAPGDTVQYGVCISNSEVGLGAIIIQPLIYQLICTNGMIVNKAIGNASRRIHKGSAMELKGTFRSYQAPELRNQHEFVDQIRNTLKEAIAGAQFQFVVDQMRKSREIPIEAEDLPALIKMVGNTIGIRETEQDGVLHHLLDSQNMTLYGLANAVTRYAQDVSSYDRSTQLEAAGYELMTMPMRQWMYFNQMAAPQAAA